MKQEDVVTRLALDSRLLNFEYSQRPLQLDTCIERPS